MSDGPLAPKRRSQARERILTTADRLFYDEGIHAVGIQRILAESRVTRVTLYRHFPSKDDLISAYLERRAQYDRDQVAGIIDAHPDDPRLALTELATALTRDDFAAMRRGCPFINASAEFVGAHPARLHAYDIRHWVTERIEELLTRLGHSDPRSTAAQLMMVRTGAVVSGALDRDDRLNENFLTCWDKLIDDGLPQVAEQPG
jgi:AcrR family transcriptional regulator